MSDLVHMTAFAATYDSVEPAELDYQSVKDLYYKLGLMDTFDAAVIRRNSRGRVKIVKRHEQPTRQGGWEGAGLGLAAGLIAVCFPAAALGTGLVAATTAAGAAAGALAGHIVGGMSRGDLKDIGEALDNGQAGLVVIAATDVGDRVANALASARKLVRKTVQANAEEFKKDLKEAADA